MTVVCDFCSSPDVRWRYPARDFVANKDVLPIPVAGSAGGWAACPVCHALIQRGDRVKLASRSAKRFARKYGVPQSVIAKRLRALHDQFWSNREGDPIPYAPDRADARYPGDTR